MEGEFSSVVTSADTRIMVLRDILQEERTQKTRLQEQVKKKKREKERESLLVGILSQVNHKGLHHG